MCQKLPKYSLYSGKKRGLARSLGFPAKNRYRIRVSSHINFYIVSKLVQFTDVDWVMVLAREEKKGKAEFWDAEEDWPEVEMVEGIFCDAPNHFFDALTSFFL